MAAAGLLLLAACGDGGGEGGDAVDAEIAPQPAGQIAEAARGAGTAAPAEAARDSVPAAAEVAAPPRVAYVYRYALELPTDRALELMKRHERACAGAGPAVCQVIGSESNRIGRDELSARLEIRATPAYIGRFRDALAGEAEAAGGRVAAATTESEDLTRALVDTEARLRAQTTLRDRLQQLLATRSAPLEQLLATERELARVQGDIDAIQSNLAVMRTRVATSRLEIEYRSAGRLAPDSAFRPVSAALDGALAAFMTTLATLITVFAVLLPIALIVAPVTWLTLRRRRAARTRKAAATPPANPDQP